MKQLFLKTYGKQRRKLSAWISPENRKRGLFDSTASTDGDTSVFEPAKPPRMRGRKTNVAARRATRPAKQRAMLTLTEKSCDEDNIPSPSCHQSVQQSKTIRESRRSKRSSSIVVRPAEKKATLPVTETSSNEENISMPSPPRPLPTQQNKRKNHVSVRRVSMRQKGRQVSRTSESEEDSTSTAKSRKTSARKKTDSNVGLSSAGRFVTRRRRAVAAKPKLPKATSSILNSSDDFTSGAFGSSRIFRPSRRRRARVPQPFVVSSAENSVNAAGAASFATNPSREISLNESADLKLCPRKPIFCSTPSAGPFSKRPCLKPLSINDQSATPPSMSVSCIGVLSTFQEDSPGQPVSPPQPVGIYSEEKILSSVCEQEPSGDLFMESKKSSCSEEDKKTKNGQEIQSLILLSTNDSESNSHFVSAAGGLEWLIEALKEKCLTERCTVQLEKLYNHTVSQLCSQTTYSSCLEQSTSSPVHSQHTNEHLMSADSVHMQPLSLNLHLSVTNNKSSCDSPEHAAPVTDSQNTNKSPSVDYKHSAEHSSSEELLYVGSINETADSSSEFNVDTDGGPVLFSEEAAAAVKNKCLTKKWTVHLKKLSLPQLRGFMQPKEADLSSDPDANRPENDHTHDVEDLSSSGEISERMMEPTSPVVQSESSEPETEKADALISMLKEKCLTDKLLVEIKRPTLSQLKEILQRRDRNLKSATDVSDSASDDQTTNPSRSESDTNHCNEDASATRVAARKRASTSCEDKTASDKEEAENCNILHKRKKTSLAPKENKGRSTSTDRPATTRKVCVSGLSVSRWKTKDAASANMFRSRTAQTGGNKTVDCSINELISKQSKQPRELLGTTMNFTSPLRVSRLNLSSLLADFTPNAHTWSRVKAALSVHRKVLLTPKNSVLSTPVRAALADVSQDLFATPFRRTPLQKRLPSQHLSCSSLVEYEDADLSDAEKVYAECGQQRPLPWEECILPQRMKRCVKIGEGTFGEVFSTTNASGDTVALKIIPVEGSDKVNGEEQKTFGEILHEIIISKELSSLKEKQHNQTHGFIGLNDLHCVQGCYPPDFLNAWDNFNWEKGSENDRPDFFAKDQFFIILEFEFGGVDLENSNGTSFNSSLHCLVKLMSLLVAKSILHQVTVALAVAEQELQFEHRYTHTIASVVVSAHQATPSRDLHWGNVLVKTTKQKKGSFLLNGAAHSLETKGVLVRIIDYSLSRLEIDDLTVSCDISKDEELFMGQGDYQFDIYRLMRQENGNNWSNYHPHTNVLWLHYLCSKLLSMKYRGSGGRGAKDMREELTRFYDNVLQYSSATEALQNCPMFQ
ncbi:Serine/threonine-protein kinase haspin [Collichthys lucidus]|uniref:non-specific serine/threonine protein kinase n=1 Tax=Collichthys lucidus TaxID=240159 RepID=A0A4U5U2I3_COLLU|nr:Serine/threonine-protein kinase haspin [Collichthys lucidus]